MADPFFRMADDPAQPGWKIWEPVDGTRFNSLIGEITVRADAGLARVRMTPAHRHSNLRDQMHGGAMLAFVDVAMFAGCRTLGVLTAGAAVTLDLHTQFLGGAAIDRAVEAEVTVLRETGRLIFVRGTVSQDGALAVAFAGTLRKSTPPPAAG